ncbi:hypothetical protein YTPLAS73_08980 [Nitrosarchaeum sp.]|nr:hypothetical protein YTPLAS73_08980 [Nitrosarchaeum sp.]
MVSEQFNFRLDGLYSKKIKRAADENGIKSASLAAKLIKKSLDFWEKKGERGEITQARIIIAKYMEMIDESKIDEHIDDIVSYILGEMKMQVGKIDFIEFERRIMEWNKENRIEFAKFEEADSVVYLSKHDLGKNWSEIQCKVYSRMFEKMGKTVVESEFDNVTFSLTIARPN